MVDVAGIRNVERILEQPIPQGDVQQFVALYRQSHFLIAKADVVSLGRANLARLSPSSFERRAGKGLTLVQRELG